MKEYMMLFWNTAGDNGYQVKPEEMEKSMHAWQGWIGNIAQQGKLIDSRPIQYEGAVVGNHGIQAQPAIKDGYMVTGYMLCKAENKAEVEAWAKTCPILSAENGFTEIREIAPFAIN